MSVAHGIQSEGWGRLGENRPQICTVCEAMLPEAVDGLLSEAEQNAFDRHVAGCQLCSRELAEARRGAAWLAMLKSEAPEPPAGMLERILAGTTAREPWTTMASYPAATPVAIPTPVALSTPAQMPMATLPPVAPPTFLAGGPTEESFGAQAPAWALSSLLRKAALAFRIESASATFQPRLAMTCAMAFCSIALTLNLTGVRLRDLRIQNFTASGLRRSMADASASATRSFQNLRVVYQVESRVSELRSDEALQSGSQNGQLPSIPSR